MCNVVSSIKKQKSIYHSGKSKREKKRKILVGFVTGLFQLKRPSFCHYLGRQPGRHSSYLCQWPLPLLVTTALHPTQTSDACVNATDYIFHRVFPSRSSSRSSPSILMLRTPPPPSRSSSRSFPSVLMLRTPPPPSPLYWHSASSPITRTSNDLNLASLPLGP